MNIVTTFIQFFHSLISNRNKSLRKFHNIINSIIILDEIQAIPYKYWHLLNKILKYLCYEFNSWIIFLTATQPLIFSQKETSPLIKNREKYFSFFNRYSYKFNLNPVEWDTFKERVFEELNTAEKNTLIILNTIQTVKELYSFLKEKFASILKNHICDDIGLIEFENLILGNLTTHIIPKHRLMRINKLKENLMKKKKKVILITTQLIEAGVDISFEVLYRDMAPLDCIIQSAGRCNRNQEIDKGKVEILNLVHNKKTFSSIIYNTTLTEATCDLLQGLNEMDEREFNLNKIKEYFYLVKKRGDVLSKSEELIDKLQKLQFSQLYTFKLIEEKMPKEDIFVEIDEKAQSLIKEIRENITKLGIWERKNFFLKMRNEFFNYVISVPIFKIQQNPPAKLSEDFDIRVITTDPVSYTHLTLPTKA